MLFQVSNNIVDVAHILANLETVMIHVFVLFVVIYCVNQGLNNSSILWIGEVILKTNKHSNRNLWNLAQWDSWHLLCSIVLDVFRVWSIVELIKDTIVCHLTIMNNLLQRSSWVWSFILNILSFLIVEWRKLKIQEIVDTITNTFELVAEWFHCFISSWIFKFIKVHKFSSWIKLSPVFGSLWNHFIWSISKMYNRSKGCEWVKLLIEFSKIVG